MRLLTAGDVCDVLSSHTRRFPYQTLNTWVRDGIIRPAVQARGTGRHRMFAIVDVLAVAMGRGLRASGFTLNAAAAVTDALMQFTEEQLLSNFDQGRICLMVAGEKVSRRLVNREEVALNTYIDLKAGKDIGLLPIALDVKRLYDNICNRIDQLAPRSAAQHGRERVKTRKTYRPARQPQRATAST